jgi:cell shape-determining protein MreD
MRNTAFFIAGVVLLIVQSNMFRLIAMVLRFIGWVFRSHHDLEVPGLVPSLVLPLILFMGVHEYSLARGAAVAFALGYLTDLLGIAPIGLYTSTYVAIFVLARAARPDAPRAERRSTLGRWIFSVTVVALLAALAMGPGVVSLAVGIGAAGALIGSFAPDYLALFGTKEAP